MTKEKILQAIRACAKKLKHNPSLRDLRLMARVSEQVLYKRFGSLRKALEAAGLQASGPGFGQEESTLLLDWAAVARKVGKIPSVHEYESTGRFSNMPFHTRYRHWTRIPEAFRRFVRRNGIEAQWSDVLVMIAAKAACDRKTAGPRLKPRVRKGPILSDRPIYGPPLLLPEMAHAPTNESGVIFLFGTLARKLGFIVQHLQTGFPDGEVIREVSRGHWQRIHIEFEFESRSYVKHRHPRRGCDLLICWKHNWPECPDNIEVLELSKELGSSAGLG
ncbi:MAG TPA: hypothetical protein VKH81_07130 [Candidatus Angelobacter sp.]|nr:hypothetical protein [Candidatus Angelobacter sp.]